MRPIATINAPLDRSRCRLGDPVTIDGSGSDFEDGQLPPSAFVWSVDLPSRGVFDRVVATGVTMTMGTPPVAGDYTIRLRVTDSGGLVGTDEVEVRVR